MAEGHITIREGILRIDGIVVEDEIAVTYISNLNPEHQLSGVLNCLQLGARALTFASDQTGAALLAETLKTSTESTRTLLDEVSKTARQSVEKSAEQLPQRIHHELELLRKDLEKTLDPQSASSVIGRFRSALLDDYRKVTGKVREDLDLANPQSPLAMLRTELEKQLEKKHTVLTEQLAELLRQNAAKAAASAERAKGTRKGGDFETVLEAFLTAESAPRKDLVRRTSHERGLDGNLIGDFVVELNPAEATDLRIALEAKNAQRGVSALVRELDKAMKNRGAAFGISVVTDPSAITQSIVPYGDDKLLVRVSTLPDGDGWDMLPLSVALAGARWKMLVAAGTQTDFDLTRLKGDVETAFGLLNRIVEVKKRLTAGKTHLDGIAEYVDDLRRDLTAVLQRLRDAVVSADKKAA